MENVDKLFTNRDGILRNENNATRGYSIFKTSSQTGTSMAARNAQHVMQFGPQYTSTTTSDNGDDTAKCCGWWWW
jgi:hypothetical protein